MQEHLPQPFGSALVASLLHLPLFNMLWGQSSPPALQAETRQPAQPYQRAPGTTHCHGKAVGKTGLEHGVLSTAQCSHCSKALLVVCQHFLEQLFGMFQCNAVNLVHLCRCWVTLHATLLLDLLPCP